MVLPGLENNYEDLSAVKDAVEGTQQAGANGVKPGRKAFEFKKKKTFLKMVLPGLENNYEDLCAVKDAMKGSSHQLEAGTLWK